MGCFGSLVLGFLKRSAMSDDIVMQLSSSSSPSDPSLPTKLAKLEARMAGKSSSSLTIQSAWQPAPPPPIKFVEQEELPDSSSSDDDVSPRPVLLLRIILDVFSHLFEAASYGFS